jgi:hypothetical protein
MNRPQYEHRQHNPTTQTPQLQPQLQTEERSTYNPRLGVFSVLIGDQVAILHAAALRRRNGSTMPEEDKDRGEKEKEQEKPEEQEHMQEKWAQETEEAR